MSPTVPPGATVTSQRRRTASQDRLAGRLTGGPADRRAVVGPTPVRCSGVLAPSARPKLAASMRLHVCYERPTHVGLTWGPLLVVIHAEFPDADDFRRVRGICHEIVEAHGSVTSLTVMGGGLPMSVDPEVRAASARLTREFRDTSVARAIVIPDDGLRGSFFRSVVAGFGLVARANVPQRVFQAPRPALEWLAEVDPRLAGQPGTIATAIAPHSSGVFTRARVS